MMNDDDIMANIFLNYSSYKYNDEIFILKKELSKKLKIDIKDIKLIGSGHAGFHLNKKTKSLETKTIAKDLDFAIINKKLFDDLYKEIEENNMYKEGNISKYPIFKNDKIKTYKDKFLEYKMRGKIHLGYIKKEFKVIEICSWLDKILEKKFKINLKISCCVYDSEKSFLENQYIYYKIALKKINK